jgi:hypothetical protein
MKTVIDESILANPPEKELVEKATRVLEDELDESARRVEAEWHRLPNGNGSPSRFELKLKAWDESIGGQYDSADLSDEEKLAQLFNRHWGRVLKKVMNEWVERAEARAIEYAMERE